MMAAFKSHLLSSLLERIFKKSENTLDESLQKIIWRFKTTHPSNVGAFQFKGEVYVQQGFRVVGRVPVLCITDELAPQMNAWLHEKRAMDQEKERASNILGCVLSKAKSKADLLQLLPPGLHSVLNQVQDYGHPNLTQEEADAFLASAKHDLDEIKKRLLLNIII